MGNQLQKRYCACFSPQLAGILVMDYSADNLFGLFVNLFSLGNVKKLPCFGRSTLADRFNIVWVYVLKWPDEATLFV